MSNKNSQITRHRLILHKYMYRNSRDFFTFCNDILKNHKINMKLLTLEVRVVCNFTSAYALFEIFKPFIGKWVGWSSRFSILWLILYLIGAYSRHVVIAFLWARMDYVCLPYAPCYIQYWSYKLGSNRISRQTP